MDAKLKSLKVVDLKDILSKAAVAVPAKANKSDLINRVLASSKALQIYNSQFRPSKPSAPPSAPNDDLLAPPEDVDWNSDGAEQPDPKQVKVTAKPPPAAPKPAVKPTPSMAPAEKVTATAPSTDTSAAPVNSQTKTPEDEELEKRKRRAARFGVPLVEPPKPPPTPAKKPSANRVRDTPNVVAHDDTEKLTTRAARFAVPKAPASGRKRPALVEEVDADELERRKRRAKRFGTTSVGTTA